MQLVVSAGQGGGPRVTVYDANSLVRGVAPVAVDNFFAFNDTASRNGVDVTFVKNGAGRDVLVAGAGVGGAPRIVGFEATMDAQNQPQRRVVLNDYLGDPNSRGGVNLATVRDDLTVMLGAAVG